MKGRVFASENDVDDTDSERGQLGPTVRSSNGLFRVEGTVQIDGCADESNVGEGLGKIPKLFARTGNFFGVQSEVIRVAQHFFKHQPRFGKTPCARQRLH